MDHLDELELAVLEAERAAEEAPLRLELHRHELHGADAPLGGEDNTSSSGKQQQQDALMVLRVRCTRDTAGTASAVYEKS